MLKIGIEPPPPEKRRSQSVCVCVALCGCVRNINGGMKPLGGGELVAVAMIAVVGLLVVLLLSESRRPAYFHVVGSH